MKVKISKKKCRDVGIVGFLCVYFTTKLLWDTVPYIFELISLGIIAIAAIRAFFDNSNRRISLFALYIIYCMYIFISAFLNDSATQFQRAMYEYIFYSFMFWGTLYLGKRARIEDYASILLNIGMIICILSWFEYITHHYILPNPSITYENYVGFRAIVFSRTFLAHGMVLAFFAILGFYMYWKQHKIRFLFQGIFAFVSILCTGSRGPLVACLGGIFVMYFLMKFVEKGMTIKKLLIIIGIFMVVSAIWYLLTSDFQVSNPTINYFLNRMRSILDWSGDEGNTGRIVIWNYYIEVFKENIWFGVGPSQTGSWNLNGLYGATESGILKRLCELGIVGASIHYIFILNILLHGLSMYKKNKNDLSIAFFIGLFIAVFIDDITMQATEEIIVAFFMWFALAGVENSRKRSYLERSV